ncbi:MAG: VOC family protein [Halobacteriales archaeon]|nr:VOC family protein [Halobacteriales archaeon]
MKLGWLSLEVKYLERARRFYADTLGLEVVRESETDCVLSAGMTEVVLRVPSTVPRGGTHVHYAFSTPRDEYEAWKERVNVIEERDFGSYSSLYFYDHDNHCVEIGESDASGDGIVGVFEVVFEVEDLGRATEFYTSLGATVTSRGDDRERVRLDAGGFDIELWEPQLGIADGQGGVHMDVGFEVDDVAEAVGAVEKDALASETTRNGIRLRDPDGHYVTVY